MPGKAIMDHRPDGHKSSTAAKSWNSKLSKISPPRAKANVELGDGPEVIQPQRESEINDRLAKTHLQPPVDTPTAEALLAMSLEKSAENFLESNGMRGPELVSNTSIIAEFAKLSPNSSQKRLHALTAMTEAETLQMEADSREALRDFNGEIGIQDGNAVVLGSTSGMPQTEITANAAPLELNAGKTNYHAREGDLSGPNDLREVFVSPIELLPKQREQSTVLTHNDDSEGRQLHGTVQALNNSSDDLRTLTPIISTTPQVPATDSEISDARTSHRVPRSMKVAENIFQSDSSNTVSNTVVPGNIASQTFSDRNQMEYKGGAQRSRKKTKIPNTTKSLVISFQEVRRTNSSTNLDEVVGYKFKSRSDKVPQTSEDVVRTDTDEGGIGNGTLEQGVVSTSAAISTVRRSGRKRKAGYREIESEAPVRSKQIVENFPGTHKVFIEDYSETEEEEQSVSNKVLHYNDLKKRQAKRRKRNEEPEPEPEKWDGTYKSKKWYARASRPQGVPPS